MSSLGLPSPYHYVFSLSSPPPPPSSCFVSAWNWQRNTKGIDLLERVCDHINLVERDYFGLTYLDRENIRVSSSFSSSSLFFLFIYFFTKGIPDKKTNFLLRKRFVLFILLKLECKKESLKLSLLSVPLSLPSSSSTKTELVESRQKDQQTTQEWVHLSFIHSFFSWEVFISPPLFFLVYQCLTPTNHST